MLATRDDHSRLSVGASWRAAVGNLDLAPELPRVGMAPMQTQSSVWLHPIVTHVMVKCVAKINAYVPDRLEERIRTLRERGGTINVSKIATSAIEKSVESEERRLAGRPVTAILRRLRALDETEATRGDGETYGRKWAELRASRKELELVAGGEELLHFSITGDRVLAVARGQDKDVAELPDSLGLAPNSFPQALADIWFDGLFAGARSVLGLVTRATELE